MTEEYCSRVISPDYSLEGILSAHIAAFDFDALPATTVAATKRLVLDTFGAILAAQLVPENVALACLARGWGGQEATLIGSDYRVAAHHAAMVNGTLARTLELDDVHEKAVLHSTATILPVALAAAELAGGISGRELLAAVALGIDLSARISLAMTVDIGSADAPPRTMSFTYQTGILVGGMIAARVIGMDANGVRNVLGLAYSQCAGNQQGLFEGVATVRLQQGLSAMTAMLSTQLARIGFSGTRHSLEGAAGYFNAFHHGRFDRELLLDGLGKRFEVDNVSIKPFPCCKYTHTAIAAALETRAHPEFDLDRVTAIVAHVNHREYYEIVCQPEDPVERQRQLTGPDGRVRAQFSLPYVVAAALRDGTVDLHHFDEPSRHDPVLLALTARVCTAIGAGTSSGRILPVPGIIDLYLEGRSAPIRAEVGIARGHPDNPMPFTEVADKFLRVSQPVPDDGLARRRMDVIAAVARLEEFDDIRDLIALLAKTDDSTDRSNIADLGVIG